LRISLPESLSDETVRLRPFRDEDASAFAQAFRDDPALGVAIGTETDPDEGAALERFRATADHAAAGEGVELAIADAGSGEFLGLVTVFAFDRRHGRCEVGFWLVPQARGRGVARRALTIALDWAFDDLGLRRAELTTTPDNGPTIRLAESLGFSREGLLRERNFERGRPVDVAWFGLLREDWRSISGR
jgi:ribosomal-protein-alanine N-acetyltransferase